MDPCQLYPQPIAGEAGAALAPRSFCSRATAADQTCHLHGKRLSIYAHCGRKRDLLNGTAPYLIVKELCFRKDWFESDIAYVPRASTINLGATLLRIVLFWMEKIPRLAVDNLFLKFPRQFFKDGRAYLDAVRIQSFG